MIVHNVYFWLKDGVTEEEKKSFLKGIGELISFVDKISKAEYGVPANTPTRDVVDNSFGANLIIWFDSVQDHNAYQDHPAHHKFIENFKDLWEKVIVRDTELSG